MKAQNATKGIKQMGQYYNILMQSKDSKNIIAYDRHIDGEYTMAKLMEHSWWLNDMVNAIAQKLVNHPCRVAWVGDYADDSDLYDKAWGDNVKYEMLHKSDFLLDKYYLVNHDKKLIMDCWQYLVENAKECDNEWCDIIHPLPLLTAQGNDRGGGDYHSKVSKDQVGTWAWDLLELVEWERAQELDKQGYTRYKVVFKE